MRTTSFVILCIISMMAVAAHGQAVFSNPDDTEKMYTRVANEQGETTSQFFLGKGKVYFRNGAIVYGEGNHRFKNIDGKGQNVVIMPSQLVRAAMEKFCGIGFRMDEMRFHWEVDEARAKETAIAIDAITAHDNNFTSTDASGDKEGKVNQILVKENRIVLEGIPDVPFATGRSYIDEDTAAAQVPIADKSRTNEPAVIATAERKLVIREDGTIALQDIMVHLTSPLTGEQETLLRNVTLVNQYKDKLMFLEIRGSAGKRTSVVFFDKGQSVYLDDRGNPVAGEGKFEIDPTPPEGQSIAGWLGATKLSVQGKVLKDATFEFVRPSVGAKFKK